MQQYAGVYLLQNYSTCFGLKSRVGVSESISVRAESEQVSVRNKNVYTIL